MVFPVLGAVTAAVAGVITYANLPVRWTIGSGTASLSRLAQATLEPIPVGSHTTPLEPSDVITAGELWKDNAALIMVVRRPGCALCREEAVKLHSLKRKLDEKDVRLYAVVHEQLGVDQFRQFFHEDIFFDVHRTFYGPKERWMPLWMGALRPGLYISALRAKNAGISGNLEGEGRLLGAVYLIGPGSSGILYEHQESEWGDHADMDEIVKALEQLNNSQ